LAYEVSSVFQEVPQVFKVAPVRQPQGFFVLGLKQNHLAVGMFAIVVDLDLKPRILGLSPLLLIEFAKRDDSTLASGILDQEDHRPRLCGAVS
jgi:hypothetical protein